MSIYVSAHTSENGYGGWSFVKKYEDGVTCKWGNSKIQVKKNDLELLGLYKACEFMENSGIECNLFTKSQFVYDGLHKFCESWQINNWKTSNDKPVKNYELWQTVFKHKSHIILQTETSNIAEQLSREASDNTVLDFLLL